MPSKQDRFRIAVLDDYQDVALSLADWSVLNARAAVTVFNDHLSDPDAVVERLQPFDIVCVMREPSARLSRRGLFAASLIRNPSLASSWPRSWQSGDVYAYANRLAEVRR